MTIQILQGHQFDAKVRHRDDLGQTWQTWQTWVDGREAPAAAAAAAAAAAVAGSTCPALRFDQGRVWTCQAFFENTRYIQQLVDMSHMITPHLSVVHT